MNVTVSTTPTFTRIECEEDISYDLCLEVDFEDGENDVAVLNKVKGEDTVFWGKLKREETRVAAIMENPEYTDDLEVTGLIIAELQPLLLIFKFTVDIFDNIFFVIRLLSIVYMQ